MPRTCTICSHPKRREIDRAILAGESYRDIAGRFEPLTRSAIERHKAKCISTALERAAEEQTWTITGQMRDLCFRAARTLEQAEKSGRVREIAVASRETRETLMALAKLTGELDESARVNVLVQRQQAVAGEQILMLERLTIGERETLRRLVAKAQGGDDDAIEMLPTSALTDNGRQPVAADAED